MYVKNPAGRVVSITPEMWQSLKHEDFRLIEDKKADYEEMKYSELKEIAQKKGISTNRLKKDDLIKKLQELEG